MPTRSNEVQARRLGLAILRLLRSLGKLCGRIDQVARWAKDFSNIVDQCFNTLELQVTPQTSITERQAAEIALAVKNVGHALAGSGRGGYGQVYGEMYRCYSVSSYKNLQQSQYDEVLQWLHSWHADLGANK